MRLVDVIATNTDDDHYDDNDDDDSNDDDSDNDDDHIRVVPDKFISIDFSPFLITVDGICALLAHLLAFTCKRCSEIGSFQQHCDQNDCHQLVKITVERLAKMYSL